MSEGLYQDSGPASITVEKKEEDNSQHVSVKRIRKRIRSRIPSTWPLRSVIFFLLVCLVGFEENSSYSFGSSLVFASELEKEGTSSESLRSKKARNQKKEAQTTTKRKRSPINEILIKAGKRGLGGGTAGAIAGVVQVLSLMWLRTIINYQSRYGASFFQAISLLMSDGGVFRFYRGLSFALVQAPLSRFVSTAANDSVNLFLGGLEQTQKWGPGRTTIIAALFVGIWRMILMPIDTCKTVLQIDSVEGFRNLMRRVKAGKISVLYQGAVVNALSAFMSHYPWFFTYNKLSTSERVKSWISSKLLRNAAIGLVASVISDTTVNALRVVKTTKQAIGSKHNASYLETIRMILAADGWKGLFGRGLRTRIFANALQSIVFTVIWRALAEHWQKKTEEDNATEE